MHLEQSPKIFKGATEVGNRRTSGDHLNSTIADVGQNTEKSLGDFRVLAVTQN